MESVEERVDEVEEIMKQVSITQLNNEKEITRLNQNIHQITQNIDQISKTVDQTSQTLAKSHQRTEKELNSLSQQMKKSQTELNKKWGELANRMGTVIEDIVAPNIKMVAVNYFNLEIEHFMIRSFKKLPDKSKGREFDVIIVGGDKVLLNSTKTTASKQYIDEFANFLRTNQFFDYFPELKSRKLIPIFSSLSMNQDLVEYLTKLEIYALVMKGDTMELLNFDEL